MLDAIFAEVCTVNLDRYRERWANRPPHRCDRFQHQPGPITHVPAVPEPAERRVVGKVGDSRVPNEVDHRRGEERRAKGKEGESQSQSAKAGKEANPT